MAAWARWIVPLNNIIRCEDLAEVIGAMDVMGVDVPSFASEHGIEFPLLSVMPNNMKRLVEAVPTVGREDGIVKEKPIAALPSHLVEKLREDSGKRFLRMALRAFAEAQKGGQLAGLRHSQPGSDGG